MASRKKSLYEILGVPRDSSALDIDLAYDRRKAAMAQATSTDSNEMTLLQGAHDVLRDPRRRASYDASLTTAEEREAAAAASAKSADLEIEPEEEVAERNAPVAAIVVGVLVLFVVGFLVLRSPRTPPVPKAAEAAPGTQVAAPPPPPPPAKKTAPEIVAEASTSGGQVLSYSMSGQAIPIGLAVSTEDGTMITTCHGIPAGAKLVVRVQGQSYPADLLVTDEVLDLCKLQVAAFGTAPVKVAAGDVKAGDRVFAAGVNAAGAFAATEGTIKKVLETSDGRLYELSLPVGEFSSGGGIFDEQGRLVAIATYQHRSGLSIAYPATSIADMKSRQVPPPAPAAPKT